MAESRAWARVKDFFYTAFLFILAAAGIFVALWFLGWLRPFGLGGFLGSGGEVDGNERPERVAVEPEQQSPDLDEGFWACVWSPTTNENWHDDVLCTNGVAADRPILLSDQSFVTQDEMMRAAIQYEADLNSR